MKTIRTVNQIWERKSRGSYPVSRFALDDRGSVTLAMPRPLETRSYDLTQFDVDESANIRCGFTLETLIKLEASTKCDNLLGMTSDDIYLISEGKKNRFLGDQRILYVDAGMSADGRALAAAYSDMSGASYALALGATSGGVSWARELDGILTVVAISPEGRHVAAGKENGTISMFDASRRDVWSFLQGEPISALASASGGRFVVYGTTGGAVGVIDDEGARKWEVRLPGEILAADIDDSGAICAALCRPNSDTGSVFLYVLIGTGQIGWEFDPEKRLTGISLSPNGQYLASSARDGTHTLFQIVPGEGRAAGQLLANVTAQAEALANAGDLSSGCQLLREALKTNPADVASCEMLLKLRGRFISNTLMEAQVAGSTEDYAGAIEILQKLLLHEPDEPEIYAELKSYRSKRSLQLLIQAESHAAKEEFADAEASLLEVISFDPLLLPARAQLADIQLNRAHSADLEAESLLSSGRIEDALAALERAQSTLPTEARMSKILSTQIKLEYEEGMKAYNEKRYREAIFQFKKVLSKDSGHSDAKRYLGFAQNFELDTNDAINDRFSKLE